MRMATHPLWNDDYWLLVLQLYLKRPTGVKAVYAREAVDLAVELHLPPQFIHQQLQEMDRRDRLVLQLVWKTYAQKPRWLAKDIARLRKMKGFGCEQAFYEGVEVRNTFEDFFLPLTEDHELKPVMLVLILDLYFRLVPHTMVVDTPEVAELARLMKLKPEKVVQVLETFQACDPYLMRTTEASLPLLAPCQQVWNRYANGQPTLLEEQAEAFRAYFE